MSIKIGIAPDSWGVWFPASDPNNAKQPQWWRCLDEMKIAATAGCEIGPWGYMPNRTTRGSQETPLTRAV